MSENNCDHDWPDSPKDKVMKFVTDYFDDNVRRMHPPIKVRVEIELIPVTCGPGVTRPEGVGGYVYAVTANNSGEYAHEIRLVIA